MSISFETKQFLKFGINKKGISSFQNYDSKLTTLFIPNIVNFPCIDMILYNPHKNEEEIF